MTEQEIVDDFTKEMYQKIQLRHNRYAPLGWKSMDMKRLLLLLKSELAEIEEAYHYEDKDRAASEAIDVANYAMFIYHLLKSPMVFTQ